MQNITFHNNIWQHLVFNTFSKVWHPVQFHLVSDLIEVEPRLNFLNWVLYSLCVKWQSKWLWNQDVWYGYKIWRPGWLNCSSEKSPILFWFRHRNWLHIGQMCLSTGHERLALFRCMAWKLLQFVLSLSYHTSTTSSFNDHLTSSELQSHLSTQLWTAAAPEARNYNWVMIVGKKRDEWGVTVNRHLCFCWQEGRWEFGSVYLFLQLFPGCCCLSSSCCLVGGGCVAWVHAGSPPCISFTFYSWSNLNPGVRELNHLKEISLLLEIRCGQPEHQKNWSIPAPWVSAAFFFLATWQQNL